MRRLSLIGLVVLVSLAWAPTAPAEESLDWAERPDDEVYVFGLQLDRYVLTDGLIVFYDGKEAFVPLSGFVEALEFPIEVDPENGTARGWFLNDDRSFELDLRSGLVSLQGRSLSFDPRRVERHPDDLYVALSELEAWFPVHLELRFQDLQIAVIAREPLPLQERIAREERRSRIRRAGESDDHERVGAVESWFEWPFVDTSIQLSGRDHNDERDGQVRMTTTVAGIFAGLDGEATAVGDSDQEAPNFRVRLGRRSLEGGLLGPLDAREFAFGDVSTPDLPLIAENTIGRGVQVSSFDLDRLEQTNRVTLRGELGAGWEVELYRNGELIDFQTDQTVGNGRYEFSSVPTVSGLNEFRLVFFGPQGQKREQVERFFVTPELAEPQRSSFRLAFNQRNRDLISVDTERSDQPDDGENRFVFQGEHGLSETLSVSGGVASLSVDGKRHNYALAGLQSTHFGALGQLDLAVEDGGGFALGGSVQTRIGSWSFFGEQNWYENFHSELTDNGSVSGHLRSRTTVRVNGHLPDIGFGYQPLSASVIHEQSEAGESQTGFFGRLSAVVRPFDFSLSSETRLREDQDTTSNARLLIGTLLGDFRLRGEVDYDIAPTSELDQVILSADWQLDDRFGARVGLRHDGGDEELTTASGGFNHRFDSFTLGLSMEADSDGDYNGLLGLSFSLGHDPAADSLAMRARPFAQRGAVSAQVFLDRDNDGVFGPEDEAIGNAGFSGPRVPREATTADDGGAFIVGLEPYREVEIGLDEATLEDPFWAAGRPPLRVVTRPGTTTRLQFPVIETGEVDGLVLLRAGSQAGIGPDQSNAGLSRQSAADGKAASGLRVYLIDEDERVVAETVSAYDGYFFIDRVPYGRYRLSLDPQQIDGLGFVPGPSREVSLDAEEPFAISQDLFAIFPQ